MPRKMPPPRDVSHLEILPSFKSGPVNHPEIATWNTRYTRIFVTDLISAMHQNLSAEVMLAQSLSHSMTSQGSLPCSQDLGTGC